MPTLQARVGQPPRWFWRSLRFPGAPFLALVSRASLRRCPGCAQPRSEREDASAAFVTRGEGWWGGGAVMLVSLWSR